MPSVEACLLALVLGRVGDAPAAFGYDYEHEDDDEDALEALAAEPRKAHKLQAQVFTADSRPPFSTRQGGA